MATYRAEVVTSLVKVWEIFHYPCGQRLAPALREQIEGLRKTEEMKCSDEVAGNSLCCSRLKITNRPEAVGIWPINAERVPSA